MNRKIRTLLFSSLYPNTVKPGHGVFVETRLRELLSSNAAETRVVAPVPWFFSSNPRYGDYARVARTPRREIHNGIDVSHPRYLLPPKVGMTIAPFSMALAAVPTVRRILREGFDFDLIDAHYYYPDGVAAALLAKWFGKPLVITARGTDLNLIPRYRIQRCLMQWAAARADASIGVCNALVDVLRSWGIAGDKLNVMRNGVDLARFRPIAVKEARRALGLAGSPILLSVGYLVERKGHNLVIEALARILPRHPKATLVIIGEGEERENLEDQVSRLGLDGHVRFTGALPNTELATWYSSADALILASSREGWANVLLEAMACGTPVVATRIWGTPEVVATDAAGRLVDKREPADLADGIERLLAAYPERRAVRAYAEGFSWDATTQAQLELFRKILSEKGAGHHA